MEIGVCGDPELANGLARCGVDYLEVGVQKYLDPRISDADHAATMVSLKQRRIPVRAANGFLPGTLRSTGPDADVQGILKWASKAFERAAVVGIESIVFGSGGSRQLKDGWPVEKATEQFVDLLRQLGPIAQEHGVTVVIEPLNTGECNFINTLVEGAEVVRAADHPNIRLLADFYHMLRNEESPADVARCGDLLHHCHIAEKANRTACGVAGDDFRPFLRGLRESGYSGRLSFECGWGEGGPVAHAGAAVAELRKQLSDAGY